MYLYIYVYITIICMYVYIYMYIYIYTPDCLLLDRQSHARCNLLSVSIYSLYLIVCFDNPMCEVMLPAGNCEFKTLQD